MKKIILEEHFSTPETQWDTFNDARFPSTLKEFVAARLADIEQFRLPDMDQNEIAVQVLSLNTPGIQAEQEAAVAVKKAKKANDVLAEMIRQHPTRLAGFAALPLQDPAEAASELERAVKQLGFKGALINGHTNGEYLDERKFWGVFERAEALGVPIYLDPIDTPHDQLKNL